MVVVDDGLHDVLVELDDGRSQVQLRRPHLLLRDAAVESAAVAQSRRGGGGRVGVGGGLARVGVHVVVVTGVGGGRGALAGGADKVVVTRYHLKKNVQKHSNFTPVPY